MSGAARTVDTVLFDLDDTLHDDSTAYKRAARRVAEDVARERGVDAELLLASYIAQAGGFWKKLSVEHLALPIHDARTQLWSDALVASEAEIEAFLRGTQPSPPGTTRTALLALAEALVI